MRSTSIGREVALQTSDQKELARIENLERDSKADAARLFKLALRLDTAGAKIEEINSARYFTAFFEYDAGNYHNAAVLGDFLARKFPKTAEARQGARIALASWVKLYSEANPDERGFEATRVQDIANFIVKTWPDQIEAAEATATLLNFAIQERNINKVLEYLERIPADSPQRADSELRAGQALWASYLKASRLPEEERPGEEELNRIKKQAAEILEKGATRLKETQQPSPVVVAGIVSLGQILIDSGSPEKAIAWLEDEKVGPLRLLKEGHAAVQSNDRMPIEIYKLTLRAYVAVEPQRIDDAEQIMDSLEKAVGELGDAKASETLTLIYIALGRELQQQLEELRASKQTQQLKTVSEGFEKFLTRIATREKGNTWTSLSWVAETFSSLGAGFEEKSNAPLSRQAKRYYEQAISAYQKLIERAVRDSSFAPNPEAVLGTRLRMSKVMRKIGMYDDAIATILAVLKERPMMLPAQVMGAESYQAKGIIDQEAYALAILGGKDRDKKGQPVIWGWSKISKLTMNNDKFLETFHQSRIELARCRFQYGILNKDKNKRNRTIDAARQDLWITYKLYPQLGGEDTMAEYNRLLMQIQRSLGEKPLGLEEFRRRAAKFDAAAELTPTTS
jgi:tetratricopeptide (TPR) repeat protein